MRKEKAPTVKTVYATKEVVFQMPAYRLTGEELYYFTAHVVCDSFYNPSTGQDEDYYLLQVDEMQPIFMEVAFDYDATNSHGQTVLTPARVDEVLKGQDYQQLISYLNDALANDQYSEVDLMPGDAGFTPYYITNNNELLVSVHDPALPGVVLVEAA